MVSNIGNLWFTSLFTFCSNLDLAITSIQENVANYDISLDNTICSIYFSSGLSCFYYSCKIFQSKRVPLSWSVPMSTAIHCSLQIVLINISSIFIGFYSFYVYNIIIV